MQPRRSTSAADLEGSIAKYASGKNFDTSSGQGASAKTSRESSVVPGDRRGSNPQCRLHRPECCRLDHDHHWLFQSTLVVNASNSRTALLAIFRQRTA